MSQSFQSNSVENDVQNDAIIDESISEDQEKDNNLQNVGIQENIEQDIDVIKQDNLNLLNNSDISKPKKHRRTRSDTNDRDFNCGCGKSYLSYPALYTHLKQKHNGSPPPGTSLPDEKSKNQIGRPPNQAKKQDSDGEIDVNDLQHDESTLQNDILFLNKFLDQIIPENVSEYNIKQEKKKVQEIFPTKFFEEKDYYLEDKKIVFGQDNPEKLKFNQIISLFIIYVNQRVPELIIKEIILLICLFNIYINNQYKKENSIRDEHYNFGQKHNAQDVFNYVNNFISNFNQIYEQLSETQQKQLDLIGISNKQITNISCILFYFAKWLSYNRYCPKKLRIKNYN